MRIRLMLVVGLSFAACSEEADPPPPPAPPATVGPNGGEVASAAGAVVTIPAGALDVDTAIRAEEIPASRVAAPPAGVALVDDVLVLTPHGTAFALPVTVTLPYSGADTNRLALRLDDENDPTWEVLTGATFAGGVATLTLNRFSILGVGTSTTFAISGTVTGLTGMLVLQNGGLDQVTITSNGQYVFPIAIADGNAYLVSVMTQPTFQTCIVSNGTGAVMGADVTNVDVDCTTDTYTVGGTVSGLSGSVTLQNNGGDDLVRMADGAYTFATALDDGTSYDVTVSTQPAMQTCGVTNPTGTLAGAAVNNVDVFCNVNTHTVGGTVSGLNGTLVLRNNMADDETVTMNGPFTFMTAVPDAGPYAVTVFSEPSDQRCSVSGGAGNIMSADVTTVSVTCVDTHSLGGVASGVSGTVVLQNNLGDDLNVTADGPFAFATRLSTGQSYDVTVDSAPAGLTCTVTAGMGMVAMTDITSVGLSCEGWRYPADGNASASAGNTDAGTPSVAMNGAGDALVVWTQADGAGANQIFMSQRAMGTWTHPTDLTDHISPSAVNVAEHSVAMNDAGDAIVVWTQFDGTNWRLMMSEYRGGMWTHPAGVMSAISPAGPSAAEPSVAIAANGHAVIAWHQGMPSAQRIYVSEYRGMSWSHPADLMAAVSPAGGGQAAGARVGMADNGHTVIAWSADDGTALYHIYMSEHDTMSWTHPSGVSNYISPSDATAAHTAPRVAVDGAGDALITWAGLDVSFRSWVYVSERRMGGWTHPAMSVTDAVNPAGSHALQPNVAMSDGGDAVVIWHQADTTSATHTLVGEYRMGSWSYPASRDNPLGMARAQGYHDVAMNDSGRTLLAWSFSADRYLADYRGATWTAPDSAADAFAPPGVMSIGKPIPAAGDGVAAIIAYPARYTGFAETRMYIAEYR